MRTARVSFLGLFLVTTAVGSQLPAQEKGAPPPTAAPRAPDFLKEVRPLLKSYCFECHSTNKRRSGLDLEKIATQAAALDVPEMWDQVGERVHSKEMPPGKSKQPTEGERQALLAWAKYVSESQVSCS